VVKAQVLKGGRGKAGAILFAENEQELREAVHSLLGATIFQEEVTRVLVEEKIAIERNTTCPLHIKATFPR